MSHIPVNHPMRTFYRTLAALTGLYILVFGVVAFSKTKGDAAFDQHNLVWALGLRANMAFAVMSIAAGAVILVCTLIGRNIDRAINFVGGIAFMVVGMLMLALLRTDANFLGFSMTNVVVSFIIGTVLFAAGLYGKAGSAEQAAAEEHFRHHH
jgi:hypothetical protein